MYLNAFAFPSYGKVSYNLATILNADSDAEVAGVLAHELAHILMHHVEDQHPLFYGSALWAEWEKDYDKAIAQQDSNIDEIKEKFKLNFKIRNESLGNFEAMVDASLKTAMESADNLYYLQMEKLSKLEIARRKAIKDFDKARHSNGWGGLSQSKKIRTEVEFYKVQDKLVSEILNATTSQFVLKNNMQIAREKFKKKAESILRSNLHPILRRQWDSNEKTLVKANELIAAADVAKRQAYEDFMAKASNVTKSRFDKFNWQEAEADNVGLELFIRAGFDPTYYNKLEQRIMPQASYAKCLDYVKQAQNDTSVKPPHRGEISHPDPCYRIFDTLVLTKRDHPELVDIYDNAKLVDLIPGKLQQLKLGR